MVHKIKTECVLDQNMALKKIGKVKGQQIMSPHVIRVMQLIPFSSKILNTSSNYKTVH